jgi:hypothetical protein
MLYYTYVILYINKELLEDAYRFHLKFEPYPLVKFYTKGKELQKNEVYQHIIKLYEHGKKSDYMHTLYLSNKMNGSICPNGVQAYFNINPDSTLEKK